MLWLDMQGIELDVLKASPKILQTVKAIATEVEFVKAYKDQYLYEDVKAWLGDNGFVMIGSTFPPISPREQGYWFGDALFVRTELILQY